MLNGAVPDPPSPRIDHRTALASGLFDSPGVYAFLIGSGMSSAAGILTGWQVAQELVRRVARDRGVDLDSSGLAPEEWWEQEGFGELSYSALIEGLAETELARRALLRRFFEPGPANPVGPSAAHHRLAQLCGLGLVKVILTTNFDPLIEQSLATIGLVPQVISSEGQVKGMTPLHHARLTVIKVHGDYASPVLKNTALELSRFGRRMNRLLDEVFDCFGLVSVGWSATWDHALRGAIERRSSRRYPTYYAAHRGELSETAERLVAQQGSKVIAIGEANVFFDDLLDRIQILSERASRRSRPRRSREYRNHLNMSAPPQGWTQIPLLTIRVVGIAGAAGEDVEDIGPEERASLVAALNASKLVARLQNLQGLALRPRYADVPSSTGLGAPPFAAVHRWQFVEEAHQTTSHAVYRIGSDGSSGVSALAELRGQGQSMTAGTLTCIVDMGFSVEQKLQLEAVAELLCTGLIAVTAELPSALANILAPSVDIDSCEIQLLASNINSDGTTRQSTFADLINLSPLESWDYPTPANPGPQMMYAAHLTGALTRADATDLTVDAIGRMAGQLGYMDPRRGQEGVRKHLEIWAAM